MRIHIVILSSILLMAFAVKQCNQKPQYQTTGAVYRLDPGLDEIIAPGALPEILAEGFTWSEGPLWLPDEMAIIFSDIPENSIFRWDESNGLQLYLKPAGYTGRIQRGGETGSNGLLLDSEGNLVLCQHGDRRIAIMNACTCKPLPDFETLADRWDGKRFNSPNDAVFANNGDLYFTDPAYGMEFRFDDPKREMDFAGVYKLDPDGEVVLLIDTLSAPNGIGLSPDNSRLYVANSGRSSGLIWTVYDLGPDGMPSEGHIFYDANSARDTLKGAPDGLVVRSDGVIFATGPGGAWIFRPDGTPLGIVKTGQATSNCTLDADEKYLYITADMYLMRIRLR